MTTPDPQQAANDESRSLAARVLLTFLDDPLATYDVTDTLTHEQLSYAVVGLCGIAVGFGDATVNALGLPPGHVELLIVDWVNQNNALPDLPADPE